MRPNLLGVGIAGWLVPGAGHLLAGAPRKAAIFFIVLTAMFVFGLSFHGELFAFDTSDLLVFLATIAQWAIGVPHVLAGMMSAGHGEITAATYEYGNTFLIVGGLLNMLVVLDALDVARGATRR
jgi:hypothetical protein